MTTIHDIEAIYCDAHGGLLLDPLVLPCGHSFCSHCITTWIELNPSCPGCRKPVDRNKLVPNYRLNELISVLLKPKEIPYSQLQDLSLLSRTATATLQSGIFKGRPIVYKQPYFSQENLSQVRQAVTRTYQTFRALEDPANVVTLLGITLDPPGIVQEKLSCSLQSLLNVQRRLSVKEVSSQQRTLLWDLCRFIKLALFTETYLLATSC
ncbi:hypothetical protein P9112_007529 [Eukaryota sp. TZLM1-RC]